MIKKNKLKLIPKLLKKILQPKSKEELLTLIQKVYESKLIDSDSLMMLEGVLGISEMQARDVMIPRSQVSFINLNDSLKTIIDTAIHTAHSRFPVVDKDSNNVVGILLAKDLVRLGKEKNLDLRDLLRPPVYIPESKKLNVLLKDFRSNRNHMAIVVDEYAGIAGILTIEDVLEQIVGDIEDEFDYDESEDNIIQEETAVFRIKASTEIEEFNEYFKTSYSPNDFQTVGGLVISKFGQLPKKNDAIHFDGFDIVVLRSDSRRIYLLRFSIDLDNVSKDILN
jgi:magnesium and cobalt transporter